MAWFARTWMSLPRLGGLGEDCAVATGFATHRYEE